uniref:Uncharacterized protein n=1 Tax=Amphimedon queenslandica TaxID=400682 RepID=A0A1X7TLG0_AMPQE
MAKEEFGQDPAFKIVHIGLDENSYFRLMTDVGKLEMFIESYDTVIYELLCRGIAPHPSKLIKECRIARPTGKAPGPHGSIDFVLGCIKEGDDVPAIVCMTGPVQRELEDISIVETKNEESLQHKG